MRGNVNIIKKLFVIQFFTAALLTLSAEPYRVYPILFVHGINSGPGTWGEEVEDREVGNFKKDYNFIPFLLLAFSIVIPIGSSFSYLIIMSSSVISESSA